MLGDFDHHQRRRHSGGLQGARHAVGAQAVHHLDDGKSTQIQEQQALVLATPGADAFIQTGLLRSHQQALLPGGTEQFIRIAQRMPGGQADQALMGHHLGRVQPGDGLVMGSQRFFVKQAGDGQGMVFGRQQGRQAGRRPTERRTRRLGAADRRIRSDCKVTNRGDARQLFMAIIMMV